MTQLVDTHGTTQTMLRRTLLFGVLSSKNSQKLWNFSFTRCIIILMTEHPHRHRDSCVSRFFLLQIYSYKWTTLVMNDGKTEQRLWLGHFSADRKQVTLSRLLGLLYTHATKVLDKQIFCLAAAVGGSLPTKPIGFRSTFSLPLVEKNIRVWLCRAFPTALHPSCVLSPSLIPTCGRRCLHLVLLSCLHCRKTLQ